MDHETCRQQSRQRNSGWSAPLRVSAYFSAIKIKINSDIQGVRCAERALPVREGEDPSTYEHVLPDATL